MAFRAFLRYGKSKGADVRGVRFRHGATYKLPGLPRLYASYHPSPRNTYTGKLKQRMLTRLLAKIERDAT